MENNENLVTEEVTENVEQTTEQTPKMFTQEEVDAMMGKRLARQEAKIRKEYEKQDELVGVLKAGMGKDDLGDIEQDLRSFYGEKKGIKMPPKKQDVRDIEVLAKSDAEGIIGGGFDDVIAELDRLKDKGVNKMTAREQATFKVLADYVKGEEQSRQLSELGIAEEEYNSKEFKEYAALYKEDVPITKVYENYTKTQPKKEIKPMGSIKNTAAADNGVKDFYSFDEARKFSVDDFRKNPALQAAVEKSMTKW